MKLKIGSDESNDIYVYGRQVEKFHCEIFQSEGSWYIVKKNENSPLKVDGKEVIGVHPIKLDSILKIGSATIFCNEYLDSDISVKDLYLKDFISLNGTIDKTNFRIMSMLAIIAAPIIIYFGIPTLLLGLGGNRRRIDLESTSVSNLVFYLWIICGLAVALIYLNLIQKRIRDIDKPKWYFLIPFYNFYLLWTQNSKK